MNYYAPFLKWWLFFTLTMIGTFYAWSTGGFSYIFEKDAGKMTIVVTVLYYFMSVWCGIKTFQVCKLAKKEQLGDIYSKGELSIKNHGYYERLEQVGWLTSEICMILGMIGTIIGFVHMLSGFGELDVTKTASIQALLGQLGVGMGTAWWTTLFGLVAGALLKIQYLNFGLLLQKYSSTNH